MLIISLIKEDIFTVVALRGVLLQNTLSADTVLVAQLLPELVANYLNTIMKLVSQGVKRDFSEIDLLWLPHWPTCNVIISLGIVDLVKVFKTMYAFCSQ